MSRLGAFILGAAILTGCAYYNTLYNSERLYQEAESLRREGADSAAAVLYHDVIRKTADAYRGRPGGEGAAETLFLLGRAQLRVGQPREASAALERGAALARDPLRRSHILVHLAVAHARLGDEDSALALVEEALGGRLVGRDLGEAYLTRARLRLGGGAGAGWDDLDRAAAASPSLATEAGLERLRQGIRHRDLEHTRSALADLLADRAASARLDTISALVSAAATRWSPSVAATMLGDIDEAVWSGAARSRLTLQQARLLRQAGDTATARELAGRVARGRGESVADARVLLAGWTLQDARDLGEVQSVIPVLLPSRDDPRVNELVEAVDEVDRYAGMGVDNALGWFAAAEVARDRLQAPVLARGLFLAYADTDPADPWAPKALLAALAMSRDEEDRSWLRGRLEAHRDSPYVQAARGGPVTGFDTLEEELRVRLSELAAR